MSRALIVVDVQRGFEDPAWGRRNNPAAEDNVARLIEAWRRRGEPIVFVRHDSRTPGSPLAPGTPGNAFHEVVSGEPDLLVTKTVHSSFHGTPDLDAWLRLHHVGGVVVCGIQTNMCCETTARVADDLGYDMTFALDATYTFDLPGISADELARATAATLAADFGTVAKTDELV
ncbi:MAG TPA: cysteine hydrolase family protein [Solirubrobacteraceae bacterium]|nr:cysteine hydrolase family protein [Solirubrobacteraceae bacterium]